ncbi:hypothetical protein HY993_03805 [Candidatus Micrarchaeota archaeon]|nr:hypothetical protein [Candidatus Micrarchaeota archaeon]
MNAFSKKISFNRQSRLSGSPDETGLYKARSDYYRKIIERYSQAVSSGETKTIPQLKELVNPNDKAVLETRLKLFAQLNLASDASQANSFSLEKDFPAYAKLAFELVQKIQLVKSEVETTFWMNFEDLLSINAGDSFDKALFLCSLLTSAGCATARVRVLELEGGVNHPVVMYFFENKEFLLDSCSTAFLSGQLSEIMEKYYFDGKKTVKSLFEFNNLDYTELD